MSDEQVDNFYYTHELWLMGFNEEQQGQIIEKANTNGYNPIVLGRLAKRLQKPPMSAIDLARAAEIP